MVKKILLLIILFVVLMFVPMVKINATQVYIGVQVSGTEAPGYPSGTDANWCLPGGLSTYGAQMAIMTTNSCWYTDYNYPASDACNYCSGYCVPAVGSSSNPVYTASPACVGDTIWSGLLDLTNGADYKVYLYTPNFCPGYMNGYCQVADTSDESCCDVCSHYGLTAAGGENDCANNNYCFSNYNYDDSNCSAEAGLMKSNCSSCTTGASYSFYSPSDKSCFTTYGSYNYYTLCSAALPGYNRNCICNYSGSGAGFNFPFTASF